MASSTLVVQTDDSALFGIHELTLTAVVNDSVGSQLSFNGENELVVNIFNTCAATKIIPEELEDMTVRAGQEVPIY